MMSITEIMWDERAEVAASRATPGHILAELAEDHDEEVRGYVAGNRSTPVPVLEALCSDPSEEVREHVAGNHAATSDMIRRLYHEGVRERIHRNPNTPADVLEALFADEDGCSPYYYEGLARHEHTPERILRRLARIGNVDVRMEVAMNPSSPLDLVLRMSERDRSPRVRQQAYAESLRQRAMPA